MISFIVDIYSYKMECTFIVAEDYGWIDVDRKHIIRQQWSTKWKYN